MREGLLDQAGMRIQQLFPTVYVECLPRETVGLEKIAVSRYLKIQDLMKLPLQWGETQREKSMSSVWDALNRCNNEGLGNSGNWGGAEIWIKFTWTETWRKQKNRRNATCKGPEVGTSLGSVRNGNECGCVEEVVLCAHSSHLQEVGSTILIVGYWVISDIFTYHLQTLSHF